MLIFEVSLLLQDGFRDDSLRIMKDIERVNPNYQVR